ncbi:MAG: sugar nucleotide-binding protein [Phycisphaerales bacterium]|nr:sugar nucleotide-binding protein [Hyphomonadaceae bacterium]
MDQTGRSGHWQRLDDIDAFAALGLKALRYPLLWEHVAPERPGLNDWRLADRQMVRLHDLKLRPIVGLVHHGSGPLYVDLLSPDFAAGLAAHAREAARRFPWVQDWTPVNEPLTTARFAGLYGHWYPHHGNERSFFLALLNQIDGVRLAMAEVRKVNPQARLVQTDDLGRTYSTDALNDQARYDNERRWLGWDLLFGCVTKEHPMWERLIALGFERRVKAIADAPCAPDIVGINHYLTSDRFLDHRCERYPHVQPGGNCRTRYVDVEAVRALTPPPAGVAGALREAWARYGVTLAITEAHNACTRDEQVRWFASAWRDAQVAREEGVDVAAVTSWSLLGAYDWDSLLTRDRGHYEPGAFDVSSGQRRPTALAHFLRRLADDPQAAPDISGRGWWTRDIRFTHPPSHARREDAPVRRAERNPKSTAPIMIVGASGTLGQALARACGLRDMEHRVTTREEVSLCDEGSIEAALDRHQPRAVINAAGWVRVDDAEREIDACRAANTQGAALLARICAERETPLTTFSSDLVFDGASASPYTETSLTKPLNIYGASKADAERAVLAVSTKALIVRTAAFFSPHDPYNFAAWVVRELREGRPVACAGDSVVSPTYVPALAHAVLDLVLDAEAGLWHVVNEGAVSWAEFAVRLAEASGLDARLVETRTGAELGWVAPRPRYSAMTSGRGRLLRDLDEAIWRFSHAVKDMPTAALHRSAA